MNLPCMVPTPYWTKRNELGGVWKFLKCRKYIRDAQLTERASRRKVHAKVKVAHFTVFLGITDDENMLMLMLMLMLMTHYGVWNIWIRRNCWHFACTRHITGDAVRTPCTRPHSDTRSSQDFDPSCQKVWNRTTRRKKVKIYHITGFSQGDWLPRQTCVPSSSRNSLKMVSSNTWFS